VKALKGALKNITASKERKATDPIGGGGKERFRRAGKRKYENGNRLTIQVVAIGTHYLSRKKADATRRNQAEKVPGKIFINTVRGTREISIFKKIWGKRDGNGGGEVDFKRGRREETASLSKRHVIGERKLGEVRSGKREAPPQQEKKAKQPNGHF